MNLAKQNSAFHIRLFGFASHLGSTKHNEALARDRMNAVVKFLQLIDQRTLSSLEVFQNLGETASSGPESDNSAEFRAVEIHLFVGEIPTAPPPNAKPLPTPALPLPGGPRFTNWSIAAPGGVAVGAGLGFGFNMFVIKNPKTKEQRGYIQPAGGIAASISLSGLKGAAQVLQQILTGTSGSPPDFVDVKAKFPVTFAEIEACLVRVSSAGAGVVKGASFAVITMSGAVSHHGPSGAVIRTPEDIFKFISAGENFQLGAGASSLVGPLKRIA
jgi:hypothetical protein